MKYLLALLLLLPIINAATLSGTIYNIQLEPEPNILIKINQQQFLSKDGHYSFELPEGTYEIAVEKNGLKITENVNVNSNQFTYDLFLIPDFSEEEQLWQDVEGDFFNEDLPSSYWPWLVAGLIAGIVLYRIYKLRKRHGSISQFRKKIFAESQKSIEQHKKELEEQPGYIDQALEIIKKHDGRISQKELRKEMLYLSEAKISLIVTELEHKGIVEKVKKGRGNVILLK